jgi:hypothetical protein
MRFLRIGFFRAYEKWIELSFLDYSVVKGKRGLIFHTGCGKPFGCQRYRA